MSTNNKSNEQFTEATLQSIESASSLVQASIESLEKLTKLTLGSSKEFLKSVSNSSKQITGTTNPKEIIDQVNKFTSTAIENSVANCHEVYEVLSEAQAKVAKVVESQVKAAKDNMNDAVESISKLVQSNPASESIKNFVDSTNHAVETMTKLATQAQEFASNNFKSATEASMNAVKKSVATSTKK